MKPQPYLVYKILNKRNNRAYIGVTGQHLHERIGRHRNDLSRGVHVNKEMQEDYNNKNWERAFEQLASFPTKAEALAYETEMVALEVNPYNNAKNENSAGNARSYSIKAKDYVYCEAAVLIFDFEYTTRQVVASVGISPATINKIRHDKIMLSGREMTSFQWTMSCGLTTLFTQTPANSEFYNMYYEVANG